jgi:hypothetical protein
VTTPLRTTPAPAEPDPGAPTAGPSITAPALGLVGATAALLTGGWLMYAPFVLGYQADGAEWADPTVADFWAGLGLGVLALVAMGVLVAGLVGALRARGVITARPKPVAAAPEVAPPVAAPTDDLTALLRPLIEALARDSAPAPVANGVTTNHRVADPVER